MRTEKPYYNTTYSILFCLKSTLRLSRASRSKAEIPLAGALDILRVDPEGLFFAGSSGRGFRSIEGSTKRAEERSENSLLEASCLGSVLMNYECHQNSSRKSGLSDRGG
jgi:hypothetical protein